MVTEGGQDMASLPRSLRRCLTACGALIEPPGYAWINQYWSVQASLTRTGAALCKRPNNAILRRMVPGRPLLIWRD
jgi:hypothetical protein